MKKSLFLFQALLLISFADSQEARSQSGQPPNVVVIYSDDIGYGDIGAYGAEKIDTPNIDSLARNGVRFTNAYASASTCTPSRYSLLTGEYAFRKEGASILPGDAPMVIDSKQETMASVFNGAGYTTGVIGKWHLGLGDGEVDWNGKIHPGPLELGFDQSFIMPSTNDRVPTVYVSGHRVHKLDSTSSPLRVSYDQKIGDLPTGETHPEKLRYQADRQHSGTIVNGLSRIGWMKGGQSAWWNDAEIAKTFTNRAQQFIRDHQDQPFFLYLPLRDVHVPRWPADRFRGESETGLRGDAIEEADWVVGEIASTLQTLDLEEETLILFSSDNGPVYNDGYQDGAIQDANGHLANGRLRGGKYQSFEGGTRVPFIAAWPGRAEVGVDSEAIISQVDLMATLAKITGADFPVRAAPDSKPLPDVLLGKSEEGRTQVVQQGRAKLALRRGKWKYIPPGPYPDWVIRKHNDPQSPIATSVPPPDQPLLFNLEKDPSESKNLFHRHPKIAEELSTLLEKIRRDKASSEDPQQKR